MASLQKTSSQRTKDRIQEIRNRVFQETSSAPKISNEDANIDKSNDVLEANKALIDPSQKLEAAQEASNELPTAEVTEASSSVSVATNEAPKQHNSDKKSVHQEVIDFESLKVQITDEINTEFSLLKKRTDEKLTDFVSKIPDIQKGSKIRDELLHDIEIMISQKVIEQNQSIDGLIKKLEMSFASANDLVEMQENLEKSVSQKFESDLEFASSKFNTLDAKLDNNIVTADEFNRSIRTDVEALTDYFRSANEKADKKLENNSVSLSSIETRIKNSLKTVEEFNSFIREDIDLNIKKLISSNKKFDTKFQNSTDEFLNLQNGIDDQHKFLAADLNRKIKQTDNKINGFTTDTENRSTEINSSLIIKINNLEKSVNQKFDTEIKDGADRLLSLKRTLEAQQKFLSDSFSQKVKTNNDPIIAELRQLDKKYDTKVSAIDAQQKSLSDSFSQKLKTNNDPIMDKLGQLDKKYDAKVSAIDAQQKSLSDSFSQKLKTNNDPIIAELGQLDKKYDTKVSAISSSLENHLSSAFSRQEKKIETLRQEIKILKDTARVEGVEVKSLLNKQKTTIFDQMTNSKAEFDKKIRLQTDHTDGKFALAIQKFTQNAVEVDKNIKLQEVNNDSSFNLLKQEFKDIKNEFAIDLNKKIDSHLIEFSKSRKENITALLGLKESFEKKVNAISSTFENTQDINQDKLNKLESLVTADGLESSTNLKKEIEKLTSKIYESNTKLSTKLITLIDECKNTVSQKIGMPEVESFFNDEMNQKLDTFSNRMGDHFQTIHKNIKTVEELIVKEDDLTELFKNYALNLTIGDGKNFSKK